MKEEAHGMQTIKQKIFMNNSLKAKIIIANSNASKLMLNKKFGIEEKKLK